MVSSLFKHVNLFKPYDLICFRYGSEWSRLRTCFNLVPTVLEKNAGWGEVQKVDTSHLHREREDKHQFQYILLIYIYILHYMCEVGTSRLSRGTCLVAKLKQQRVHALIQRVLLVVRGCTVRPNS